MSLLVNRVESLVVIVVGTCIILLRKNIFHIFVNYASKNAIDFSAIQQRILLIIIWTIGIVGIFGGIIRLLKTILK